MAAPTAVKPKGSTPLRTTPRRSPFPLSLYQSAVGKKWVMAVTGLILVGFVIFHMLGNLKLYLGVVELDGVEGYDIDFYAEKLRTLLVPIFPEYSILWLLRIGLILAFVFHIHSAYTLSRMSQKSNQHYAGKRDWLAANYASRTMRWTGPIILFYVIFHIADLTIGSANPDFEHGEVYHNVIASLSRPAVAIAYMVANVALVLHLYHGIWSAFQSLGINNPRYNYLRRWTAIGISALILVGNLSFPIAVLSGIIE